MARRSLGLREGDGEPVTAQESSAKESSRSLRMSAVAKLARHEVAASTLEAQIDSVGRAERAAYRVEGSSDVGCAISFVTVTLVLANEGTPPRARGRT